jgi:hypothetical protein
MNTWGQENLAKCGSKGFQISLCPYNYLFATLLFSWHPIRLCMFCKQCNYKLRKVTHPSSTVLESKQNSLVKHLKKSDFIN